MKLLAIDSATECLALAAIEWHAVSEHSPAVTAVELDGGALASARALPEMRALLRRLNWCFEDLDAIAFGRGPGGFTGLRTACAVAQGLAYGQGLPVVAVDSLAIVAEDAALQLSADEPLDGLIVWAAMDARMDEIYVACYQREELGFARWRVIVAPALMTVDALNALWLQAPPMVIAGSALAVFGARLHGGAARRMDTMRSRAHALGRLAAAGFMGGEGVSAEQALPVYLRDKVAQTTAERERAKAVFAGGVRRGDVA